MTYLQESEDSASHSNKFSREKSNMYSANGINLQPQFLKNTGQKEYSMATSQTLLPTPQSRDGRGAAEKTRDDCDSLVEKFRTKNKKWSYLQEDFPANHSATLDEDRERQTTATSGLTCLQSSGMSDPTGSSLKMCVASLLGAKVWYSNKCALTWKAKATKSNRLLFQLSPSMRRTGETESGLLLTVTANESVQDVEKFKKRMEKYPNGTTMPNLATQIDGLLPTAVASDATTGGIIGKNDTYYMTKTGMPRKVNQNGTDGSVGLARLMKLLPTPDHNDGSRGAAKVYNPHGKSQSSRTVNTLIGVGTGKKLRLQPAMTEWMMGYPEKWTEFLIHEQNGEKKV